MSSLSDKIFTDQYEHINSRFKIVSQLSVSIRIALCILTSFERAFGNYQWASVISFNALVYGLGYFKNSSLIKKKLYLFLFLQYCYMMLRCMSILIEPQAELLFCMLCTIAMLLYETCIFHKSYWVVFIILKNMTMWCFLDFKSVKWRVFREITNPSIIASISIIILSCHFELEKVRIMESSIEATEKCKAARDQLYDTLKVFPDGLIVIDSDHRIKFQNNMFTKNLATDKNPVHYLESVRTLNGLSLIEEINEFLLKREVTELSLGVVVISSKQYECRVHKIKWDGEVCCMLTIKDVSSLLSLERIKAENTTKNLIIRSISHEFRTPITCIILILEEIFPKVQKEIQQKLEMIKANTELLTYQLGDILDYTDLTLKRFTLSKSEVNIKQKLKSCMNLIKFQAEYKNIKVSSKIDMLIPDTIFTDGYRIRKIIVNLLTNALKHTSSGSIKLYATNSGENIIIGVKDTGSGISPERLNQLFQMFSDTSNSALSGLGLHICKKILEHFGSDLKVESVLGSGSHFSFNLRQCELSNDQTLLDSLLDELEIPDEGLGSFDLRNIAFKSPDFEYPKILIVDDNDFNRMCLSSMLRSEGLPYHEASNGSEAVQKVLQCHTNRTPLKCIIMDLNMPVMDGWEASRSIHKLHSQGEITSLPAIIAHTAYCSKEDLQKCQDSGMACYLIKPTAQSEILSTIQKYI